MVNKALLLQILTLRMIKQTWGKMIEIIHLDLITTQTIPKNQWKPIDVNGANTNAMVKKKHIEICNSLSKFSKPLTFSMVFCFFLVFRGTGPIGFHFLSENLSFFTSSRFVASLHICVALHFPTSKTWMNEGKWQIM